MQPADKITFEQETNGGKKTKVTVPQYYAAAYSLRLQYPFLPCLGVKGRDGTMYFPAEVCNIVPGRRYGRRVWPRHEQLGIVIHRKESAGFNALATSFFFFFFTFINLKTRIRRL